MWVSRWWGRGGENKKEREHKQEPEWWRRERRKTGLKRGWELWKRRERGTQARTGLKWVDILIWGFCTFREVIILSFEDCIFSHPLKGIIENANEIFPLSHANITSPPTQPTFNISFFKSAPPLSNEKPSLSKINYYAEWLNLNPSLNLKWHIFFFFKIWDWLQAL